MKLDKVVKRGMRHGDLPPGAGTDATFWFVIGFSEAARRWFPLGWIDRHPSGDPRYEVFGLDNPTTFPRLDGPVPVTVPLGGREKCANATQMLREWAEPRISKFYSESYDEYLSRNMAEAEDAAKTVVRGGFCKAGDGVDVARVLGMVMLGRVRWTGRWQQALVHLDGSMSWIRVPTGLWNRLLHDLERDSRRIVLNANGVAVLRVDDPAPDDRTYVVVPRVD